MKTKQELLTQLKRIDHKSYGMYKSLSGAWRMEGFILHIDHVQGDPFASPSRVRVELNPKEHGFPSGYYQTRVRAVALEDFVLRRCQAYLHGKDHRHMGSGKSGRITICPVGQKVLERIAVLFSPQALEVRFEMGFPARGRTILAGEMEELLCRVVPDLVKRVTVYPNWTKREQEKLRDALRLAEDQQALREMLVREKLTAFVADGAVLPRESGVSDRPMRDATAFSSPASLRRTVRLPHRGEITGMGIPEGITVIVGGGYHGKSTLLKALEQGVYNHVAGDGREYVVSRRESVKIRAEDGRYVRHTDISLFINHLPNGQDTRDFSSENASGSTSQAANLIEAMETGAKLMFLDEDTCATNFMIRDRKMAALVSDEQEPITTLLRHIRGLYTQLGISFILVVGSSGDYFSVADLVLQLDHYRVKDVTQKAKMLGEKDSEAMQDRPPLTAPRFNRKLVPVKPGRIKVKAMGTDTVLIDREAVDVRYLEQLADPGQTVGLAYLMEWILTRVPKETRLTELVENIYQDIAMRGFLPYVPGNYPSGQPVLPRKQELYACLSRYRSGNLKL